MQASELIRSYEYFTAHNVKGNTLYSEDGKETREALAN